MNKAVFPILRRFKLLSKEIVKSEIKMSLWNR